MFIYFYTIEDLKWDVFHYIFKANISNKSIKRQTAFGDLSHFKCSLALKKELNKKNKRIKRIKSLCDDKG
jgi:hypothetical protein